MLISNDQFFLQTNKQGQISSIKFNNEELLFQNKSELNQSFAMVWPIFLQTDEINNNFWTNLNWEWIREDKTLTLLATHFSDEKYSFSIDIQCFITLNKNILKIKTLFSNIGHKDATFNFALHPFFKIDSNSQLQINGNGNSWQTWPITFADQANYSLDENIVKKEIVLNNNNLKITTAFNADNLEVWKPKNSNFVAFKLSHHPNKEMICLKSGQQWSSKIKIKCEKISQSN